MLPEPVDVTNKPTPLAKVSPLRELGKLLIVTVAGVPSVVRPVVDTPEPLTTTPAASEILIITPVAG